MADIKLRSPGIEVRELDLTGSNELQANPTIGAYVGAFEWGPANTVVRVQGEGQMAKRFGAPTEATAISFLSAANFLRYSNNLRIVRSINPDPGSVDVSKNSTVYGRQGGSISSEMIRATGGSHLNAANIVVTFSAAPGGGSTATANVLASQLREGRITGLNIINPGSGYVTRPTITVSEFGVYANAVSYVFIPDNTFSGNGSSGKAQYVSITGGKYTANAGELVDLVISVPDQTGTNAVGNIFISAATGQPNVETINISSGVGYTKAPSIALPASVVADGDDDAAKLANTAVFYIDPVLFSSNDIWENYPLIVQNNEEYLEKYYEDGIAPSDSESGSGGYGPWVARYPGTKGNSLKVSVCDGKQAWFGPTADVQTISDEAPPFWVYAGEFDSYPQTSDWAEENNAANDEMHIVVVDELGAFSGVANTVLEKFAFVSKMKDAKTLDGAPNYYKDVIFRNSQYVHWLHHPSEKGPVNTSLSWANTSKNWGSTSNIYSALVECGYSMNVSNTTVVLSNGATGLTTSNNIVDSMQVLKDKDTVSFDLLFTGDVDIEAKKAAVRLANRRKDFVAFLSPSLSAAQDPVDPAIAIVAEAKQIAGSTYAVYDSGWKYVYDKYNDKYRWIPLNSDMAGLCARTDRTRDPWFSPAGQVRGQIRNSVKLAFNPSQQQRDRLYTFGVNPVVTFPGEGTMLFGDKTFVRRDTAFNRINVRRLFLVLEKVIADAARASLFEFNDEFTRAQFVNLVEPYLRTVKGRRGIYDFQLVCDTTNNTPEVIDANQFVGDIYIKPAKSINFIQLNFVAVRTGVEFSEVVGRI